MNTHNRIGLKKKQAVGMYTVSNQENIGIPDIIREVKVVFNVKISGVEIPFERTVVYKYNDGVKGEMYNFLDIVPEDHDFNFRKSIDF